METFVFVHADGNSVWLGKKRVMRILITLASFISECIQIEFLTFGCSSSFTHWLFLSCSKQSNLHLKFFACCTSSSLRFSHSRIFSQFTSPDGRLVNYEKLKSVSPWKAFLKASKVHVADNEILKKSENERKCFFISILWLSITPNLQVSFLLRQLLCLRKDRQFVVAPMIGNFV